MQSTECNHPQALQSMPITKSVKKDKMKKLSRWAKIIPVHTIETNHSFREREANCSAGLPPCCCETFLRTSMASATLAFKASGDSSKCKTSVWSISSSMPVTLAAVSCSSCSTSGYKFSPSICKQKQNSMNITGPSCSESNTTAVTAKYLSHQQKRNPTCFQNADLNFHCLLEKDMFLEHFRNEKRSGGVA